MTRAEIIERWRSRLADWKLVAAQVDGEKIAQMVLLDLTSLDDDAEATLSLTEASAEGGVSTRQLSRLIKDGKLKNLGRPGAPKVRRSDIPRKAAIANDRNTASLLSITRTAVASKVVTRGRGNGTQG